jgi:ribose-phosphate pyrophosphokinase
MRDYASRVVKHVTNFPRFSDMDESINGVELLTTDRFADGEMEVSINKSVRGKNVVLFASSCIRNDAGLSVEEAKIELYHAVDALKRSQAGEIIVFEPYISCSRSDRTTRRNSVGLWVHFKILVSLGVKHILTYQLHSNKSVSMLDPTICTIDNIPALNLLKRYLCDTYIRDLKTEEEVRLRWAFCSVDAGGEKLAREFANAFGAPLVVAHKQRDYSKANTVESINILSAEPVEGKVLWIVDDMIDTAGSVESLIRALSPLRPKEMNIIAPHAIFSPPAAQRLNRLSEEKLLNRIIVADTISSSAFSELIPRIEVVPSAELSAGIIRILVLNESMGKLMRPFSAEKYLKSPGLFNA